jgi:hypothetical protein
MTMLEALRRAIRTEEMKPPSMQGEDYLDALNRAHRALHDALPERLTPAQIDAVCAKYVRIRVLQDGKWHGSAEDHRATAECMDAWRLAFAHALVAPGV